MTEFARLHPLVCFLYLLAASIFAVTLTHPVCVALSFAGAAGYLVLVEKKNGVRFLLRAVLPLYVLAAAVNPLFSHAGVTVLAYFPSGNPLTLESILYGLEAAGILASMVCLCACIGKIMTEEKWICVLGHTFPSLALVLAMAFRLVPRLTKQAKDLYFTQSLLENRDKKVPFRQLRLAGRVMGILVTKTFENAADTAVSMKARGYGTGARSAFSVHRFGKRDAAVLLAACMLAACVLVRLQELSFRFYPSVKGEPLTLHTALTFAAYGLFCLLPVLYEGTEVFRWNLYVSKI